MYKQNICSLFGGTFCINNNFVIVMGDNNKYTSIFIEIINSLCVAG
jgi:hypothetical protein